MEILSLDPFFVQKKLRNLTGVAIRHLDVGACGLLSDPFAVTFCLSFTNENIPYFTSEPVLNSANPTWEEVPQADLVEAPYYHTTTCVFQLFVLLGNQASAARTLLRWELDFRALIRIAEDLQTVDLDFGPNTVIILLKSGLYVFPHNVPANMKPIPLPSKSSRKSYGPSALRQLLKLEKDFAQIRERRDISYATIRQATEASASRSRVLRGKEQLIQRLRSFREVLHGFNQDNISLRQSIEDIALQNQSMMHTLELNKLDLVNQKNELESSRSDGRRNLEEQRRMDRELRERRCELVGDLNLIYPINRSKSGRVFVANIWLPPMDQFSSCDDTTLSASLGYTVHLLILLSRITGVPLRYPLKFNCSASSVINMAAARVSDRDREYPLHTKVRDRMRFLEAVNLLNRNVIQLRLNFGQGTQEVKKTLENIQNLMQERFRAQWPRAPSLLIPPSPAVSSEQGSPFSPMSVNGSHQPKAEDIDGTVPPVSPAVMFPTQSVPDFSKAQKPLNNGGTVYVQNRPASDVV